MRHHRATASGRTADADVQDFVEMSLDMLEEAATESALVTHGKLRRWSGGRPPSLVVPRGKDDLALGFLPVTRAFSDAKWRALKRLLLWQGWKVEEGYAK